MRAAPGSVTNQQDVAGPSAGDSPVRWGGDEAETSGEGAGGPVAGGGHGDDLAVAAGGPSAELRMCEHRAHRLARHAEPGRRRCETPVRAERGPGLEGQRGEADDAEQPR